MICINQPSLVDKKDFHIASSIITRLSDINNHQQAIRERYKELYKMTMADFIDPKIDFQEIISIQREVREITLSLHSFSSSLGQISAQYKYASIFYDTIQFKILLDQFQEQHKQELIILSYNISNMLSSWISHHATELAELEKQIQSQEMATENNGGKAALELSRISLQEHLKELEKVRM